MVRPNVAPRSSLRRSARYWPSGSCCSVLLRGRHTLALAPADTKPLHVWLSDLQTRVGEGRNTNPLFTYFFNPIRSVIDAFGTAISDLIAHPVDARPVPYIGWLGVVVLFTFLAWVLGNWKVALLTLCGLLFMGLQGLWQESMETLALTIAAVAISLLIGIPLGIWAGISDGFNRLITPVLDFMQILPSFVYLAPLTLAFLIGPAAAIIATVIYAAPPVIRLTAHGIRSVPQESREAVESLGATRCQELFGALLPMAKRTIVLGINQTIMAALAMVTIAALIAAPGLGQVVIQALSTQDVGTAFNAGLAIVIMAIILDRTTTAASERVETQRRKSAEPSKFRRPAIAIGAVVTAIAIWLSYTYQLVAIFPSSLQIGSVHIGLDVGTHIVNVANAVTNWAQTSFAGVTNGIKDVVTAWALDPLQTLLDSSPWWLTFVAITAIAAIVGGRISALITAVCLGLILWPLGLWQDTMDTLAAVLVATVIVVALGVVVGVWMGRSPTADKIVRPFLDAAQTMPSFVYLVPFLALFSASRFTGIVAAIVYAAPGVDQDHGRRDPRGLARDRRGGPLRGVEHLAGDQQGAAADGRAVADIGHQPGPYICALDGRGRRSGRRRRAGLPRGGRLRADQPVRQGLGGGSGDRAARHDPRPHDRGRIETDRTDKRMKRIAIAAAAAALCC